MVLGERKKFLVSILAIDRQLLDNRSQEPGFEEEDKSNEFRLSFLKQLEEELTSVVKPLPEYLQPAGFLVIPETFSVQTGELTANLKLRRKNIVEKYQKQIDQLYDEIENSKKPGTGAIRDIGVKPYIKVL